MISDKLFKELYGIKGGYKNYNSQLIMDGQCPLSIYEVANKCKEWAWNNKVIINSRHDNTSDLWEAYININVKTSHSEIADSEPEAIFKAGDFILNKINGEGTFKSF